MVHTSFGRAATLADDAGLPMSRSAKAPRKSGKQPKTKANLAVTASIEDDAAALTAVTDVTADIDIDPAPIDTNYVDMSPARREEVRTELQDRLSAYLERGRPRVVVTDNIHTMVSIKRGDGVVTFRLHHMFHVAPSLIMRALGRYADRQDRDSAKLLRAFIDANDAMVRQRDSPRPITVDVQGKYHNLQEILDRLNGHYFGGNIKARITWGPRARRKRSRESIKLGSYTFEDELIRIHPVLDAADVPRYFVEWIVYHEMLHEVHDMPVVDGRRVYHTPEFRQAEARFERYADAVLWERTQLHKLLER